METAYLSLGSNQGDRQSFLEEATALIRQRVGAVVRLSPLYETAPWGRFEEGEDQPFLNMALAVETALEPRELLAAVKGIEADMGRHTPQSLRDEGVDRVYRSRPIDIDIVLYGMAVAATPELTLPHPRMHLRRFVLQPLCDIAPDVRHPLLDKTIKELLEACPDTSTLSYCS